MEVSLYHRILLQLCAELPGDNLDGGTGTAGLGVLVHVPRLVLTLLGTVDVLDDLCVLVVVAEDNLILSNKPLSNPAVESILANLFYAINLYLTLLSNPV